MEQSDVTVNNDKYFFLSLKQNNILLFSLLATGFQSLDHHQAIIT